MTPKPQRLLSAVTLKQAQTMTGRIWARHRSSVPDPESFRSDINRQPLGRSHVSMVVCESAIHVDAEGCPDRVFVYLPMEGKIEFRIDGERVVVEPGAVVIFGPDRAYEFDATPVRCLVIEVPFDRLQEELRTKGLESASLSFIEWPAESAEAGVLTLLARFLLAELEGTGRPPASKRYCRRMEAVLLNCLARALAGPGLPPLSGAVLVGRRTVEEIATWLHDKVMLEVSPDDLAAYAGLTPRSMQRAFIRHFHTTPTTYLKGLRLDAARRALLAGRGRVSVSEVAAEYFFHHLGRFAAAYRQRFGESPSATLAGRGNNT